MKNTLMPFLGLLLSALLIVGCGGPIETLKFDSPEGTRSVTVSGVRETPAAPITLTLALKNPTMNKDFNFEFPSGSLTKENCVAKWENEAKAVLTFTMSDGEMFDIECFMPDDKLVALKNFKIDGKSIF